MDHPLRYAFHSHAAAFGGHIVRPKNLVLEAGGASALVVTGGRCHNTLERTQVEDYFVVENATTIAEGFFDDPAAFRAVTNHKRDEQTLTAISRARSEVNGLAIGRTPRLTIKRLQAELTNRSAGHSGQPSFAISADTLIDGISIDGYKLKVVVDTELFCTLDTHVKVLSAMDDAKFVKKHGEKLFLSKRFGAKKAKGKTVETPAFRKLITANGTTYATIVKSITWVNQPFPKSSIQDNMVVLPGFGRIFLGELLITDYSRRLTMIRMALGSDSGGSASAGDVATNGGWSP